MERRGTAIKIAPSKPISLAIQSRQPTSAKKIYSRVICYRMHIFGYKIQQFYGGKGCFFFEELFQQVNSQALAPFFRPWLHQKGLVLDAGSGSGHLAEAIGLSNSCFLDLTWEQLKRCQYKGG